jgi:hypothetical protein
MAAEANNTVEIMNSPEIKLTMPAININPINRSLVKVVIIMFLYVV